MKCIPLRRSRRALLPSRLAVTRLEERATPAILQPGFAETTVASGLSSPTSMEFSPDGSLFIAEQTGTMQVWRDGVRLQQNFFRDAPIFVQTFGERGLLGVAFDPNFASNRYVYVSYTTIAGDNHQRISRFTANAAGDLALPDSETILVELDDHFSHVHYGGEIQFGPDGKLYVSTGDAFDWTTSQSLTSRHGKILRYNSDGTIPNDNPTTFDGIEGETTGIYRAIWAVGLRNPFSFAFQPGTGRMLINDVGEALYEEINIGAPGANYGWSATEGPFDPLQFPNFAPPLYAYDHNVGQSITGAAFYNPPIEQFPASYHGDYFFADFVSGWIKSLDLATNEVSDFASNASGPVDLLVGPDGSLYYLSYFNGVAQRVTSAPRVTGTAVNDGSAQRSMVTSLAISFNSVVTFDGPVSSAFSLSRVKGGSVSFQATASVVNGVTVVAFTNFSGSETGPGGSLRDGRYVFRGLAGKITFGSLTLDGNGDGVPTADDDFVWNDSTGLFRFFGDINGDRRVDIADFGILSTSYLNAANYIGGLDYDGNGRVDIADFGQFSVRYLTQLP